MNERIRSALHFISSDDREVWLMAAMAIKSEMGESGFDMWDSWSAMSDKYKASAARAVWKSCRGSGVTMGSLIHEAKAAGWRDDDKFARPTAAQVQASQRAAAERLTQAGIEREAAQQHAAKKAAWILYQCKPELHAYLDSKGRTDQLGAVWWPNERQNLLCIPMRVKQALVGVQLINREGKKRYLTGQRTSGASYVIDNSGHGAMEFWCEGYITGLSLRDCLKTLGMRYAVHICFSASNMKAMALAHGSGIVIADNDKSLTGQDAAQATGLPYWLSDVEGEDFDDYWRRVGSFKASQAMRKWLTKIKSENQLTTA